VQNKSPTKKKQLTIVIDVAYFLHLRFFKYGTASNIAVVDVSTDAIMLSAPIINTIAKNKIDHKGDTLKVDTAYGITINARPGPF
jgi:hypothetical protein